jgi:hypothetical protein
LRRTLGHSSIAITARYLHASEDEERDASRLFNRVVVTTVHLHRVSPG